MNKSKLPVDALEAVGLDELTGVASLLTRRDRKYLVPVAVAARLVAEPGLRVLEIDGLRTFSYESVYFDTEDLISYRAAAHKRRRRFKVRTRSYLDSGVCSLEIKTRERRGLTEKHRLPHSVTSRDRLTVDAVEFINGFDSIAPVSAELRRSLTTRYGRTTLLHDDSASRITIDTGLECEIPDGSRVELRSVAIVETKTTGPPCAIDRFIWEAGYRPVKISKYCTGLAALSRGLPANKWNRVLRKHFGWTPEAANDPDLPNRRVASAAAAHLRSPRPIRSSRTPALGGTGS